MSDHDAGGQELVSIGEAAARLGTDVGQLRRFLKRPKNWDRFKDRTETRTRETRTGTRTATLYPFPLVAEVWAASRHEETGGDDAHETGDRTGTPDADPTGTGTETPAEKAGPQPGPNGDGERDTNRDRDRDTGTPGEVFTLDDRTRAYLALLTQEMRGRIEDRGRIIDEQAARIAELTRDRDRLQSLLDGDHADQKAVSERVSEPEAGAATLGAQVDGVGAQEAPSGDPQADTRPWWKKMLGVR